MSSNISVDVLFPDSAGKKKRTGKIDIESLFNGTTHLNSNKDKFTSDELLGRITEMRKKKLKSMIDQYNKCCRMIKDINNKGGNYVTFIVPHSVPECATYSSIDALKYISDNLRKDYLDTTIISNVAIFISWEDIELKKELARIKNEEKEKKDNISDNE